MRANRNRVGCCCAGSVPPSPPLPRWAATLKFVIPTILAAVRHRFPINENCRSLACAPNDKGASGPRFSAAPTALKSCSELSPSPSGLGSRLAAGPPGLTSMAILQRHFFLNLLCKLAARDDKGKGSAHLSSCYPGRTELQVP